MGTESDRRYRADMLTAARAALADAHTLTDILRTVAVADISGTEGERLDATSVLYLARQMTTALERIELFTSEPLERV